jgi:hypothetical protein
MDNLAKKLRDDARKIECAISEELDDRIRASLQNVTPEPLAKSKPKSFSFWFASSLTGVAAAIGLIAIVNLQTPEPAATQPTPTPTAFALPVIELKAKTAVLTAPLEQEIENLQSDIKKAEEAVNQDIDRLF